MSAAPRLLRAGGGPRVVDVGELWQARDLLALLVRRDLVVRYRPTLLGPLWAVLQPMASTLVFSLFLGGVVGVSGDGAPYAAFVVLGLLPWSLFASGVSRAAASLVTNAPLLAKARFPRVYLPLSAVATALLDLVFSLPALAIVLGLSGVGLAPGLALGIAPLFLAALLALGLGLLLASLSVRHRDLLQALPFVLQLGMFATPVLYPQALIPQRHRGWLVLNPMAAVVEGLRDAGLGRSLAVAPLLSALAAGLLLLGAGLLAFRKAERLAVDGL